MKRNMKWQVLALAAGLLLSVEALAQEVNVNSGSFGSTGQVVISDDMYGSIGYTSGAGDYFFITLNPAADYFLKENLSLGGFVTLATQFQDGDDPLTVGLGVRGGYNIPLNSNVSVWPKLGLAVAHTDYFGDRTYLEISLTAPFLVHLAPHFFVGGGPGLVTQLGDDTIATLSVTTVVGGYF
ncbi:hypothetical protein [Hyalangium versicolor]|uniref:hypothetical protein n=1 Tax=Hyalangium versicolor TaxID=2861190 RepID=UPI001CCBCF28|nr:hypothetical protein [Hyalangium versicolor]